LCKNNIILITIDALRADYLKYFKKFLEKYPRKKFTNAFSNAPHTSFSVPSFMTSKYPPVNYPSLHLGKILKEEGYSTAAFVPNAQLLSPDGRKSRLDSGFDVYLTYLFDHRESKFRWLIERISHYAWDLLRRKSIVFEYVLSSIIDVLEKIYFPFSVWQPYPRAEVIIEDAIKWLKTVNEPYFLWMHLMDVHWPYAPPDEFLKVGKSSMNALNMKAHYLNKIWRKKDVDVARILYRGEIDYVNHVLLSFIDSIPRTFDYLILTSDHGEQFFEHNKYGHTLSMLYDENIKVPLVIMNNLRKINDLNINDFYQDVIEDKLVSLIDLVPTIVCLSGINKNYDCFCGSNLFSNVHSDIKNSVLIVGRENKKRIYCLRTDKYKIIKKEKSWEFYDLKNDPKEKNNIFSESNSIIENMKYLLFEKINENLTL